MSSIRVTPWALISALPTVVTGAIEVRFGDGMRVPVTTISETSPFAVSAAAPQRPTGSGGKGPGRPAPQIIEEANRRSLMLWIFKVYILRRSTADGDPLPKQFPAQGQIGPDWVGVSFD